MFSRKISNQINSGPRQEDFDKIMRKSVTAPGDHAAARYIMPRTYRCD